MIIRIVTIKTKNIHKKMQYYDDIAALIKSHRGFNVPEDLIYEPLTNLKLLICNGKAVSIMRYGIKTFFGERMYYINLVHTLKEYRRQGFSRKLFQALFSRITTKSCLEVSKTNEGAIKLYESLGFKKIKNAIRPEEYTMIR